MDQADAQSHDPAAAAIGEQGKRVEALDVYLMTLLQEVEVKANPPTKVPLVKASPPTEIRSQPLIQIGNGSGLSLKASEVLLTATLTALLLHFSLLPAFRATSPQPPSPQQSPVEQPKEK